MLSISPIFIYLSPRLLSILYFQLNTFNSLYFLPISTHPLYFHPAYFSHLYQTWPKLQKVNNIITSTRPTLVSDSSNTLQGNTDAIHTLCQDMKEIHAYLCTKFNIRRNNEFLFHCQIMQSSSKFQSIIKRHKATLHSTIH